MFRTRDFILIFTAAVFLLMAIGTTGFSQYLSGAKSNINLKLAEVSTDKEYSAEAQFPAEVARADKLAEIKSKIASGNELSFTAPDEISAEATVTPEEPEEVLLTEPMLCASYVEYVGVWPQAVNLSASEGARIAYTEEIAEVEVSPATATSGPVIKNETVKNVLLQLALYPQATTNSNCLNSNVIGVAKDGTLLRNNEAGIFSVFASDTLIGYALDGFAIYGLTTDELDSCGGKVTDGVYAYYLSEDRTSILHCFNGQPANL